tara:strand:- start:1603 stop:2337 length:735 start_codon:yes stop_codon:yes gene_type:complete
MKNKRLFVNIISVLMILLVPLILYGFSFNSVAFDNDLYKKEFLKYNVYSYLEDYDIENINGEVLNYLVNEKNPVLIDDDFFNEREKTHLLDVKNLIQNIFVIYYFSIFLFIFLIIILSIILNFNFKEIVKKFLIILLFGSLLTLLDAVSFFLLSNFNFDFTFDVFHKTFFDQGTFTFNPQFENIVVLYPENLFFDFLIMIISNTILSSVIILFLSLAIIFIFFRKNFLKFLRKLPSIKTKKRKL